MKRKVGFITLISSMLFFFYWGVSLSWSAQQLPYRVFILHSYEEGHVCGQPQHDGVISALKEAGIKTDENLDIQVYCMDTKRKNNTPELIEEQALIALAEIKFFHPDVLVTLDDNAFRTVALKLVDSIPIVFTGVNGQPEDYNQKKCFMNSREKPGHNVTGVYEKLHISDAFRVHSKIFPGLKKVKIIVDESPTGRAIAKQVRLELGAESVPCTWEMKVVTDWEEYQKEILLTNDDPEIGAVYPVALILKDDEGNTYTAPKIFKWTIENSTKPEIPINYAFTRLGLFGGAAVDFHSMGQQAGEMVVKILRGENPGSIAIEEARRYSLVFNMTRAKQLGIEIPKDILLAADEIIKDQ